MNFGPVDVTSIEQTMSDLWAMFAPLVYIVVGIVVFGILIRAVVRMVRGAEG